MARYNNLVSSILKKEGEKIFGNVPPIIIKNEKEQQQILEQWKVAINALTGIEATTYSYKQSVFITIKITAAYVTDVELELVFDEEGYLCLQKRRWSAEFSSYVGTVEMLKEYATALKKASIRESKRYEKRYEASLSKAHKRDKIKSLKRQAIVAKLQELCRAEDISYEISTAYQYKLKLIAFLSKKYRIEVDIPYKNYQAVLQGLPTTLKSLQTLTESGMVFRIKTRW